MRACNVLIRTLGTTASARQRLAYRVLNAQEIEAYAGDASLGLRDEALLAGRRGRHACVGALDGDELAGYAWLAFGAAPYQGSVWVSFDLRACSAYKVFVRARWRGQGIEQRLRTVADDLCIWAGKSHAISFIDITDHEAIEEAKQAGAQTIAHAGYVEPLGFNWAVQVPGAPRFDFSFGALAPREEAVESKGRLGELASAASLDTPAQAVAMKRL